MIRAHTRCLVASATAILAISVGSAPIAASAETPSVTPDATVRTTLITGDVVTLHRTGGHYTVIADATRRADGTMPVINVRTKFGTDSVTTSINALPTDVEGLVAAGVVDRNAFDVLWLAERVKAGNTALAVTVKFGDGLDSGTLNRYASALPGATVAATHQDTGTADLRVDPGQAARFWAALKPGASIGDLTAYRVLGIAPKLEQGVLALWPTGHRSSALAPQGDTGVPTYEVTWTIKAPSGADRNWCGGLEATMCLVPDPVLIQAAGQAIGSIRYPVGIRCVTVNPCTAYEAKFVVPAGTYEAAGNAIFWLKGIQQMFNLEIPEFTADRNTTLVTDGDSAKPITVETTQPSEIHDVTMLVYRSYANGAGAVWLIFTGYINSNYWAVPSAPVTVGTFHFGENIVLAEPIVRMAVTKPRKLNLAAIQAGHSGNLGEVFTRFTGRQTLELVDGGLGRDEDLSTIDARGKLVMLQIDEDKLGGQCHIGTAALDRAKAAGAAGVLIDPVSRGGPWPEIVCPFLPIWPDWWSYPSLGRPELPYAAITHAEAEELRALMAKDTVKIEITGSAQISPYVYQLHLYQEGRIPESLHTKISDRELAVTETRIGGSPAEETSLSYSAWRKNDYLVGGSALVGITNGVRFTTYRGPVAPDLVRQDMNYESHSVMDVVDRAGPSQPRRWGVQPVVPGVPRLSPKAFQAQPGKFDGIEIYNSMALCSFCRQGNTFYPFLYLVAGAGPEIVNGPHVFDPGNIRMYADGQELPQTNNLLWGAVYDLPAEANRYRLTATNLAGTTTTVWNFTSSAPIEDQRPQGFSCVEGGSAPCQAEPLVFLRYDAGVDLGNTVTAGGSHELKVTAYHQFPHTAPITSLELSVSTDGGITWQQVKVGAKGGGDYTGNYRIPRLADTNGKVSIKAKAADADGNTIEQTLLDAFGIR